MRTKVEQTSIRREGITLSTWVSLQQTVKLMTLIVISMSLTGCFWEPKPNDPRYAPVMPSYVLPAKPVDGAIVRVGHEPHYFIDAKARFVGDLLTIQFDERMSANKSAKSSVVKNADVGITSPTLFGSAVNLDIKSPFLPIEDATNGKRRLGDLTVTADMDRTHTGNSSADQSNTLTGKMTVTVTHVFPNGNLQIRGEKWLKLNDGDEFVRLTGIVRPRDIDFRNEVLSSQIADARIAYSGTGAIADSSKAGWFYRAVNSVFWPF